MDEIDQDKPQADVTLDNPALGVQYERGDMDAAFRNYNALSNYAALNGFDDKLDTVLDRYGAGELADLRRNPDTTETQLAAAFPKAKRAVDAAQVTLKRDVDAGRKGPRPIIQTKKYFFRDKDGIQYTFDLDPDVRAHTTLQKFEQAVQRHPSAEEIESQFMPAFTQQRRELVKRGWDEKEASPWATLLAIQQLADTWAHYQS